MDSNANFRPTNRRAGSSRTESLVGICLLMLLVLIAVAILLKQSHYDEEAFNSLIMQAGLADAPDGGDTPEGSVIDIAGMVPSGFSPMSETETFDQVSLSDKIDGKADGYLDAGFLHLTCRRFIRDDHPEQWLEIYLYDMEIPRNAFSIYSKQKRDGVADQAFTEFAYATENAVFFATGRYYVEIIAAARGEALLGAMVKMSETFVAAHGAGGVSLPELAYLPPENLDTESVSLIPNDGFGYSGFDNIFTGTYQIGEQRIMAFLSIRKSPEEAAALAAGYDGILSEFVGDDRLAPGTDRVPGLVIVDLFGEYEMFFTKDNIIAGIHGTPDRAAGEALAVKLFNRISDVGK